MIVLHIVIVRLLSLLSSICFSSSSIIFCTFLMSLILVLPLPLLTFPNVLSLTRLLYFALFSFPYIYLIVSPFSYHCPSHISSKMSKYVIFYTSIPALPQWSLHIFCPSHLLLLSLLRLVSLQTPSPSMWSCFLTNWGSAQIGAILVSPFLAANPLYRLAASSDHKWIVYWLQPQDDLARTRILFSGTVQ